MKTDPAPVRFRAVVREGGTIIVPQPAASRFNPGQEVDVRVTPAMPGRKGSGPVIDEDEVADIAALQAEPAELIRACLRAQGVLSRKTAVRGKGRKSPRSTVRP